MEMTSQPSSLPEYFADLGHEVDSLESRCKARVITDPYLWNYFQMVRKELQGIHTVWRRFLHTRATLIAINLRNDESLGQPDYDKIVTASFREQDPLLEDIVVDFKSLFLYSDILLTKIVLLLRALHTRTREVKYGSFSEWLKSVRSLAGRGIECAEVQLYVADLEAFERLDVLVGFFRDKFIVHWSGPYTETMTWGVTHPSIDLEIWSWQLQRYTLDRFLAVLDRLGPIAPTVDMFGHPLRQPGDIRLKVQALFYHLHEIADPAVRQDAEGLIRAVGLRAPDIYYLMHYLKTTLTSILTSLPLHRDGA